MNKIIKGIAVGSLALSLAACNRVPAGYRGVIVNLYGSDKGVSEESVGVGRYYLGWSKEIYLFPTFLQNRSWSRQHAIKMQTSEGLSIITDAGITYQIKPENIVKVFTKYRLGIDEITDLFLHNMVRDAMNEVSSKMTVDDIYGRDKEKFIKKVNEIVIQEAAENGIDVEKIYLIGSFELPPMVRDSIDLKIQASQNAIKVKNEVATAQAEAEKTLVKAEAEAKKIIIRAESQAKANEILAKSLTSEFVQYQAILRWDGKLPQTNASSALPFINISDKSK